MFACRTSLVGLLICLSGSVGFEAVSSWVLVCIGIVDVYFIVG